MHHWYVFAIILEVMVIIAAYWAPTLIAWNRHIHGIGQIVVVNLFLGWTVIGWIVALTMAFRSVPPQQGPPVLYGGGQGRLS